VGRCAEATTCTIRIKYILARSNARQVLALSELGTERLSMSRAACVLEFRVQFAGQQCC
jgi:hypothetical protein